MFFVVKFEDIDFKMAIMLMEGKTPFSTWFELVSDKDHWTPRSPWSYLFPCLLWRLVVSGRDNVTTDTAHSLHRTYKHTRQILGDAIRPIGWDCTLPWGEYDWEAAFNRLGLPYLSTPAHYGKDCLDLAVNTLGDLTTTTHHYNFYTICVVAFTFVMHSLQQAHYSNYMHTYDFQGSPALVTAHHYWCSLHGFGVDGLSEDSCKGLSESEDKNTYGESAAKHIRFTTDISRTTVCHHSGKTPSGSQDLPPLLSIPPHCQFNSFFTMDFNLFDQQGKWEANSSIPSSLAGSPSDADTASSMAASSPIACDIQDVIEPLQQLSLSAEPDLQPINTFEHSTQDANTELYNWWNHTSPLNWCDVSLSFSLYTLHLHEYDELRFAISTNRFS
ncbi:hypothetical protein CTheo_8544 [Ceratobasidium theobromae]|uniref:Uncharacterized protein n=1 Tax=Ceratobasidium theobromae TaxID=1582974 RepID=A0A5N5Q9D6_9AGAM|nr:hypothetical protein CTheo_8544 [Ceratobasidium theobromae]